MEVQSIIDHITTNECVNCKFGKCLIALKNLRDAQEPESVKPVPTARAPIKAKVNPAGGDKKCSRCGNTKPLSRYPKAEGCRDGHAGQCYDCKYEVKRLREQQRQKIPTPPDNETPEIMDPDELVCRLCNSPSASKARLERHMMMVHGKV
jgi:hypothetical protein